MKVVSMKTNALHPLSFDLAAAGNADMRLRRYRLHGPAVMQCSALTTQDAAQPVRLAYGVADLRHRIPAPRNDGDRTGADRTIDLRARRAPEQCLARGDAPQKGENVRRLHSSSVAERAAVARAESTGTPSQDSSSLSSLRPTTTRPMTARVTR
jgi:hypothetical protein